VSKPNRIHKSASLFRFAHLPRFAALLTLILLIAPFTGVHAATLSASSLSVSDSRPSFNANYTFNGSGVTTGAPGTIKCIKEVYADTSTGTNAPTGMSTTGGGVSFDTTNSNYMPTPASWTFNKAVNGTLTLIDAAGETPASAAARKVVISGITNSSTADTRFWLRFNTYNNIDCATSPVDSASVLFILTAGSTLSLTVDQTLSFSINAVAGGQACNGATSTQPSTATTIPFGTVTAAANSVVCQDLTAATNATNGFTIYVRYTSQPQNALAQTIANHTGTNTAPTAFPAPGTEAYGYTTNDASLGTGTTNRFISNLWAGMTTSNAEVAFEPSGVNLTTYRVGHQVGVSLVTRPGTYQTTVIYTCTPVY
jgi:hypothetical protein